MRPYVNQLFNHDHIHLLLRTGRFNDPNEAGICVNRSHAYHFVRRQLESFLTSF
jgi:hypothetical protein